jgi:prophage maintenance system killer protein
MTILTGAATRPPLLRGDEGGILRQESSPNVVPAIRWQESNQEIPLFERGVGQMPDGVLTYPIPFGDAKYKNWTSDIDPKTMPKSKEVVYYNPKTGRVSQYPTGEQGLIPMYVSEEENSPFNKGGWGDFVTNPNTPRMQTNGKEGKGSGKEAETNKDKKKPKTEKEQKELDEELFLLTRDPGHDYEVKVKMKELLEQGANPNARDEEGNTPLHYLKYSDLSYQLAKLEMLMDAGVDINAENKGGHTPLQLYELIENRWGKKVLYELLKASSIENIIAGFGNGNIEKYHYEGLASEFDKDGTLKEKFNDAWQKYTQLKQEGETQALEFVKTLVPKKTITEDDILTIHRLIMKGTNPSIAGKKREIDIYMGDGVDGHPLSIKDFRVDELDEKIEKFLKWLNKQIRNIYKKDKDKIIEIASKAHCELIFVQIPVDGNKRVARKVMELVLRKGGYRLKDIPEEEVREYYEVISEYDNYGAKDNIDPFIQFIEPFVEKISEEPPDQMSANKTKQTTSPANGDRFYDKTKGNLEADPPPAPNSFFGISLNDQPRGDLFAANTGNKKKKQKKNTPWWKRDDGHADKSLRGALEEWERKNENTGEEEKTKSGINIKQIEEIKKRYYGLLEATQLISCKLNPHSEMYLKLKIMRDSFIRFANLFLAKTQYITAPGNFNGRLILSQWIKEEKFLDNEIRTNMIKIAEAMQSILPEKIPENKLQDFINNITGIEDQSIYSAELRTYDKRKARMLPDQLKRFKKMKKQISEINLILDYLKRTEEIDKMKIENLGFSPQGEITTLRENWFNAMNNFIELEEIETLNTEVRNTTMWKLCMMEKANSFRNKLSHHMRRLMYTFYPLTDKIEHGPAIRFLHICSKAGYDKIPYYCSIDAAYKKPKNIQ